MYTFNRKFGDGAHRGVSDFYDEMREELTRAISSKKGFDTGWYSDKHEGQSGRISSSDGKSFLCEASVSDDFDTGGNGEIDVMATRSVKKTISAIEKAIDEAVNLAADDQRSNSQVTMYTVGKKGSWSFTYLLANSHTAGDRPPGDYYHRWGWQEVDTEDDADVQARPREIPVAVARRLERLMLEGCELIEFRGWKAKLA